MVIPSVQSVAKDLENLNLTTSVINRKIKMQPIKHALNDCVKYGVDWKKNDLTQKMSVKVLDHNINPSNICAGDDDGSSCCLVSATVPRRICENMKEKINTICDKLDFENSHS